MLIDIIAGTRPNFMKVAPIIDAATENKQANISYRLVHTGQHYDKSMSESFFLELGIPEPHLNLGGGGGTQAQQTAKIMVGYEEAVLNSPPDICLVVGDVTSTLACSIVAKKCHIPVVHVEAGIRSGDLKMPEEINRIVTDSLTDAFFTTTPLAGYNLVKSGVDSSKIHWVGNTMIDTLLKQRPNFRQPSIWEENSLKEKSYFVLTLHRPSNVDDQRQLETLLQTIVNESNGLPIIFPVHPRTTQVLAKLKISFDNLILAQPLPYLEFNYLVERCKAVITDSGGITEEATVMNVPCMTLRDSTERPETVESGTNELIGSDPSNLPKAFKRLFDDKWKKGSIPDRWDGQTADRIIDTLSRLDLKLK